MQESLLCPWRPKGRVRTPEGEIPAYAGMTAIYGVSSEPTTVNGYRLFNLCELCVISALKKVVCTARIFAKGTLLISS